MYGCCSGNYREVPAKLLECLLGSAMFSRCGHGGGRELALAISVVDIVSGFQTGAPLVCQERGATAGD